MKKAIKHVRMAIYETLSSLANLFDARDSEDIRSEVERIEGQLRKREFEFRCSECNCSCRCHPCEHTPPTTDNK